MKKQTQQIYIAGAIVAVALIGVWWMKQKPSANNQATPTAGTDTQNESPMAKGQPASSTWEGTLKVSDNLKKGNLMLQTTDRLIYINTSRDFSALVGKKVVVTYEGTLSNFVLGDVVAK